jgi:hypothetical protein
MNKDKDTIIIQTGCKSPKMFAIYNQFREAGKKVVFVPHDSPKPKAK